MRTGRMNVPFLVQSCRLVPDGHGGNLTEWSTLAALWGSLEDFYERAPVRAPDDVTHIVTTRKREDLDFSGELRLALNERVFTIRQARNVGRGEGRLKLFVREGRYLN